MHHQINKIFICILLLFLSIFTLYGFKNNTNTTTPSTIEYNGEIEHLAFNTLISFPEKALNKTNDNSTILDETKITPNEFKKILQELYSNNYILISMKDLFIIENNTIVFKPILIPHNKKPLVLSFDNVTYKSSFKNNGEIDKIIIDNEGKFATYSTKQNIQNRIAYDNEFLTILEQFVFDNPDFSNNNAKGLIFLTINNGILGYQINPKSNSSRRDQSRITELIKRLQKSGWEFGSNNYEYIQDDTLSTMQFIKNITLWNKYLTPIISTTPYYSSPYGHYLDNQDQLSILKDNNFKIFFYNNFNCNLQIKNNAIFMSRKFVSGSTIRNNQEEFHKLFDCKKVYDYNNRTVPFNTTQDNEL